MFEKKRELFLFSTRDCQALKSHFEEMATDGWLLDKIGKFTLSYKKIEPRDLVFSVQVYPELNLFKNSKYKDEYKLYNYIEISEKRGWNYLGAYNNMQISYSEAEEKLTPVKSSLGERRIILEKSVGVNIANLLFVMLILYLNLRALWTPFYYERFYNNYGIVWPVILLFFFTFGTIYLLGDVIWIIRSKVYKRLGKGIPSTSYTFSSIKGSVFLIFSFLLFIAFILAIVGDARVNSIPIYLVLGPIISIVILSIIYNKWLAPKDIGLWKEVLLLIVILIPTLALPLNRINSYYKSSYGESIEAGYIGVKSEEIAIDLEVENRKFTKEGSILVPKKSVYRESYSYYKDLATIYIEGRNPKIAEYIFEKYLEDEEEIFNNILYEEDGLGYFDKVYSVYTRPSDEAPLAKIIVLKDNKLIYVHGRDLEAEKLIEVLKNKIEEADDV